MPVNKSAARIYLAGTRDLILKIFDYKCIMCGRPTNVIHEIVPISHGKRALAGRNRVPLCGWPSNQSNGSCHDWAHRVGTRISIPILREAREKYLRMKWVISRKNGKKESEN